MTRANLVQRQAEMRERVKRVQPQPDDPLIPELLSVRTLVKQLIADDVTVNPDLLKHVKLCLYCKRPARPRKVLCQPCADKQNASHKRTRDQLRLEAIRAYGGKCQCPGGCSVREYGFLALDHIYNDGYLHRRRIGNTTNVFRELKKLGYPKDKYRLLCHNCNCSRSYYGKCPHELHRASVNS